MNLATAEKNVKDSNCYAICAKLADYYFDEDGKTCFAFDSGNGHMSILPMRTTARVEVTFYGNKGEHGQWDLVFYRSLHDLADVHEIPAEEVRDLSVDEVVESFIKLIDGGIDYMLN